MSVTLPAVTESRNVAIIFTSRGVKWFQCVGYGSSLKSVFMILHHADGYIRSIKFKILHPSRGNLMLTNQMAFGIKPSFLF